MLLKVLWRQLYLFISYLAVLCNTWMWLFLVASALFLLHYGRSFTYWSRKKVPFERPIFTWGNFVNIFKRKIHFGEQITNTYKLMKRRGEKYFGLYLFTRPCFVPIDPQFIRLILNKDFQYFNERTLYYNEKDDPISAHLLSLNGEKWKKLRTRLTPTFTPVKLKMMFPVFSECGRFLDRNLQKNCGHSVNIKDVFAQFSTDIIANCAFGLELNRKADLKKEFMDNAKAALDFPFWRYITLCVGSAWPNLCRTLKLRILDRRCARFFLETVKANVDYREKLRIERNDFLQMLIKIKRESVGELDEFTLEEIAAQCFIFFLAGYETAASTMACAMYEIVSHPDIYERLNREINETLHKYDNEITYEGLQEMSYLSQVIDETLRMYSPAYYVSRNCTKDYYIPDANLTIDRGTTVLIPIRALHQDPEYFPEPMKFKPARFSEENRRNIEQYTYLPFGGGPRNCIGLRFGLLETKLAIAIALRNNRFSLSSRTIVPLRMDPNKFLLEPEGGIWLNCYR